MKSRFCPIVAYVAAVTLVHAPALKAQEEAMLDTLVNTRWGSAPGECGYSPGSQAPHDHACAPISFTVDEKGFIYILDVVNRRINRYDSNGVYADLIPVKYMGLDFAVTNKGKIYLVDGQQRIWAYDRETGELLWKRRFMREWVAVTKNARKEGDNSWPSTPNLSTNEEGKILFYCSASLSYMTCEFPDSGCKLCIIPGHLGRNGIQQSWALTIGARILYRDKEVFIEETERGLEIAAKPRKESDDMGNQRQMVLHNEFLSKEINIEIDSGISVGFMGMDKDENSYFVGKEGNHRVVFKYNKNGNLLATSPPIVQVRGVPSFFEMTRELVLDLEGNIYQAIAPQDGFKVIRIRFLK
jgi:hypothetical protein